jgi:hypothetical protein
VDCGGLGGNVMGSGRDSRTFQVGNRLLVDRQAISFWCSCSGTEGRGGSVTTGDGGVMEKNAVSEM